MTKSKSKAEDQQRDQERPDRVSREHGGELVEAISEEDLVSVNDADCKHEQLIRDPTEVDFIAFTCSNPKCGEVVLYNKK